MEIVKLKEIMRTEKCVEIAMGTAVFMSLLVVVVVGEVVRRIIKTSIMAFGGYTYNCSNQCSRFPLTNV